MNAHSACGGGVVSAVIVAVYEGIHDLANYSQQLKEEYTEITRTTGKKGKSDNQKTRSVHVCFSK